MLRAQPRPQLLVRHGLGAVDEHGGEPPVRVIEGKLNGDAIGLPAVLPGEVVEERVHMVALGEHASRGVQGVHLPQRPTVPHVVVPVEHPVDRDVRAACRLAGDGGGVGVAQRLELRRGHESAPRGMVRAHHAARVEVVPLVPAVVGHLVAAMGLNQVSSMEPSLTGSASAPISMGRRFLGSASSGMAWEPNSCPEGSDGSRRDDGSRRADGSTRRLCRDAQPRCHG